MKIMIAVGGFYPAKRYGGPAVSIENLVNFISDTKFYVVTRNHDWKSSERLNGIEEGWNIYNPHTQVIYLSDSVKRVSQYSKIINEIAPDLVYINGFYSINMYIPLVIAAQKKTIPVLIAPRGTLNKNAMAIKSLKKYAYVAYMRMLIDKKKTYFQSTSEEETERIGRLLGASSDHIIEAENVPSIPKSSYSHPQKEKGSLKCCFFARICEKKNLLGAIRILKNVKGNVEFNIYGNKEEPEYWEKCEREITKLPSNIHVEYKGAYDHSTVFELMAQNHIFFFPTLSENYGHVIAEAMLSGLPVVISDQTPWNDVNEAGAGYAIPLDQEIEFIESINRYVEMGEEQYLQVGHNVEGYVGEKLSLDKLSKKYSDLFKQVIGQV